MEVLAVEPVKKAVVVEAPIERVFDLFTGRFGEWWPSEMHIGKQPYASSFIEPCAGGRWYERATDGSECEWGRVIAWEPPHRIVLSWNIGPTWQPETNDSKASEVAVSFIRESPRSTRVELEHRHIERHGDGSDAYRASLNGGWPGIVQTFAAWAAKNSEEAR